MYVRVNEQQLRREGGRTNLVEKSEKGKHAETVVEVCRKVLPHKIRRVVRLYELVERRCVRRRRGAAQLFADCVQPLRRRNHRLALCRLLLCARLRSSRRSACVCCCGGCGCVGELCVDFDDDKALVVDHLQRLEKARVAQRALQHKSRHVVQILERRRLASKPVSHLSL